MALSDYQKLKTLGQGSFGKVTKVRRKRDGKELVWKEIHYGELNEKEKQCLVSEVNILKNLHHPCIVKYYDRFIDKEARIIYIIMEYCAYGDLAKLIKSKKETKTYLSEDEIWRIFTSITLALRSCHDRREGKIIHRDIKPANIFLDKNHNVKVGDFGLARILSNTCQMAHTHVGTPYYMSPEQIKKTGYDEKCDVWSLGCVLFEMCALRVPFQGRNIVELSQNIAAGVVPKIPSFYSSDLGDLINSMLHMKSRERPSMKDILKKSQVSIRVRELSLASEKAKMRAAKEELKKKELALQQWEHRLKEKEKLLSERAPGLLIPSSGALDPIKQYEERYLKQQKPLSAQPRIGLSVRNPNQIQQRIASAPTPTGEGISPLYQKISYI